MNKANIYNSMINNNNVGNMTRFLNNNSVLNNNENNGNK